MPTQAVDVLGRSWWARFALPTLRLFREQAAAVLNDADIAEEEKQSILLAMTCPCCGAGTMSFSVSMKPKKTKFVAEES